MSNSTRCCSPYHYQNNPVSNYVWLLREYEGSHSYSNWLPIGVTWMSIWYQFQTIRHAIVLVVLGWTRLCRIRLSVVRPITTRTTPCQNKKSIDTPLGANWYWNSSDLWFDLNWHQIWFQLAYDWQSICTSAVDWLAQNMADTDNLAEIEASYWSRA